MSDEFKEFNPRELGNGGPHLPRKWISRPQERMPHKVRHNKAIFLLSFYHYLVAVFWPCLCLGWRWYCLPIFLEMIAYKSIINQVIRNVYLC